MDEPTRPKFTLCPLSTGRFSTLGTVAVACSFLFDRRRHALSTFAKVAASSPVRSAAIGDATTLAVNHRGIWRIPQHQPFANRLAAHMLASMALFFRKKSLAAA